MGQKYESKKKSVSENRESMETNTNEQSSLREEYSILSSLDGLISDLEDETFEAVGRVEDVGETEGKRLEEEKEDILEEREEIVGEIEDELDKLQSGLRKMEQLDKFEFGSRANASAQNEYKKLIGKYSELISELDVSDYNISEGKENSQSATEKISEKQNDDNAEKNNNIPGVSFNTNGNLISGSTQLEEALNDNPQNDISDAFDFADRNYSRDSEHWQEVANRKLDSINSELEKASSEVSKTGNETAESYNRLSNYVNEHGITSNSNDIQYNTLLKDYSESKAEYEAAKTRQNLLLLEQESLSQEIRPEYRTTFVGRNGSDFESSYNGIITSPQGQGNIVDNNGDRFGGTCGINETCSIINMQTGQKLDEDYGINTYNSMGLCESGKGYSKNGGTSATDRAQFLNAHSITFQRIEGAYTSGVNIDLNDVARRFNSGDSIGLMLRAQDLSQEDISSRARVLSFSKDAIIANQTRFDANHATTVAGFSYSADGSVVGVWINDTGGWAGSNRVYIERTKFEKMQKNTRGLAFEFSRRMSA